MKPRLLVALMLAASAALPARAEMYKWVDANGQVNYSNVPPPSAGGSARAVEERISVMGMDPTVRAAAERRFAAQAQAEEREWQRRQQALLMQQAVQPAPVPSLSDNYYSGNPYYYAPFTYRASYIPAYYRPAVRATRNYYAKHVPHPAHHARPGPAPRSAPPPRGGTLRPR